MPSYTRCDFRWAFATILLSAQLTALVGLHGGDQRLLTEPVILVSSVSGENGNRFGEHDVQAQSRDGAGADRAAHQLMSQRVSLGKNTLARSDSFSHHDVLQDDFMRQFLSVEFWNDLAQLISSSICASVGVCLATDEEALRWLGVYMAPAFVGLIALELIWMHWHLGCKARRISGALSQRGLVSTMRRPRVGAILLNTVVENACAASFAAILEFSILYYVIAASYVGAPPHSALDLIIWQLTAASRFCATWLMDVRGMYMHFRLGISHGGAAAGIVLASAPATAGPTKLGTVSTLCFVLRRLAAAAFWGCFTAMLLKGNFLLALLLLPIYMPGARTLPDRALGVYPADVSGLRNGKT